MIYHEEHAHLAKVGIWSGTFDMPWTWRSQPDGDSDFYFVQADDPETAVPRIIELVRTRIPIRFGLDPIRDIQVCCAQ